MSKDKKTIASALYLRRPVVFAFLCFLFIITTNDVYAHKIYLFAWEEGDIIHTESYSGDKKIKDGIIKVYDMSGDPLLDGRTNEKGEFSFKVLQKTGLKIVLEAGMGHRAEYIFKHEEKQTTEVMPPSAKPVESDNPISLDKGSEIDDIRKMMEEVIDEKMSPISRRLARMEEEKKPGFTDIIGGIGYIIGIMGIIFYFKARNDRENNK